MRIPDLKTMAHKGGKVVSPKQWLPLPPGNTAGTQFCYEGDSNEKIKSAIKIQNTARLSCKLTIMILMV
jgi:hypothetical protein